MTSKEQITLILNQINNLERRAKLQEKVTTQILEEFHFLQEETRELRMQIEVLEMKQGVLH